MALAEPVEAWTFMPMKEGLSSRALALAIETPLSKYPDDPQRALAEFSTFPVSTFGSSIVPARAPTITDL